MKTRIMVFLAVVALIIGFASMAMASSIFMLGETSGGIVELDSLSGDIVNIIPLPEPVEGGSYGLAYSFPRVARNELN